MQGTIQCDSETVFELAALALHATNGDFTRYVVIIQIPVNDYTGILFK